MKNSEDGYTCRVRIQVQTGGIWRADQLARTLLAIDGISARGGVASYIAETCEAYDYVIKHLKMFGLLNQPKSWKKPKTPTDVEVRTKFAEFITVMRNVGVSARITQLGVKFQFQVDDLYDIVPTSGRAEIERISMSSPGEWLLLVSGALKSKSAVQLLDKIFDALFFKESTKRRKNAEARETEARARLIDAKAKETKARTDLIAVKVCREETRLLLDYTVAIDSLAASLRNAGFDNQGIQKVLRSRMEDDIQLLAVHKSLQLIKRIRVEPIDLEASQDDDRT